MVIKLLIVISSVFDNLITNCLCEKLYVNANRYISDYMNVYENVNHLNGCRQDMIG